MENAGIKCDANPRIEMVSVDELKPYEKNPRHNEGAVDFVANSIREFGFKVPIIVDSKNVIVAGHTRLEASKRLGIKEVPVIRANDLTEEQIRAFRLADNKVSEIATWDFDLLDAELSDIGDAFDMKQFGFSDKIGEDSDSDRYTNKVKIPQYEPQDVVPPQICALCDTGKAEELIAEIGNCQGITEDERQFLIRSAYRHNVFNYRKIAEYYARAGKEMQILMEKSALVIIDMDDAIANGFTKLKKEIGDEYES